jgi:hypothetical protein
MWFPHKYITSIGCDREDALIAPCNVNILSRGETCVCKDSPLVGHFSKTRICQKYDNETTEHDNELVDPHVVDELRSLGKYQIPLHRIIATNYGYPVTLVTSPVAIPLWEYDARWLRRMI